MQFDSSCSRFFKMAEKLLQTEPDTTGRKDSFTDTFDKTRRAMVTEVYFQDLPEIVVLKIFSFVAKERIFNLFILRRVCKTWNRLAEDASLWRRLSFPNCDDLCYEVLERILSWCGNVKEVNLVNCVRVDDKCIELIASHCPRLEVLYLSGCRSVSDVGMELIKKGCNTLRCLSITNLKTNITPNAVKDFICASKSLQEITVACENEQDSNDAHFFLTKEVLDAVKTSQSLKKMYFLNSGIIEDEIDLVHECKFDLLELGLPGCMELSNSILRVLSYTSPNLHLLDISYCPGIDDEGISTVAEFCPNLRHLIAKSCPCITDVSIESVAKHCKLLQSLNVCGCELPKPAGNITDVAVETIAENCLDLQLLNVKWCQSVTDKGIAALATNCIKLSHLNICGCLGISDVSVKVIATYCDDLRSLEIAECLRITRSSINDIVQNCTKLEYLDMQVCSYVSDFDMKSDKASSLSLYHIDLSYCTKITDRTLRQIGNSCPSLTFLSIAGCHRVTDTGVICLVQGCNKLQYFDASFRGSQSSAQITSNSMKALAWCCPKLTYLDVIGCPNITEVLVNSVVASCRYLKQLNVSQFMEKVDSQLRLRIGKCILQYRSSCSCEEMISNPRGRKLVQNLLFKMAAPNL